MGSRCPSRCKCRWSSRCAAIAPASNQTLNSSRVRNSGELGTLVRPNFCLRPSNGRLAFEVAPLGSQRDLRYKVSMPAKLSDSVKFLRGVGPRRAELLEERGFSTVGDLLGYLPFRYEDRIHFTKIAELVP